MSLTDPEVRTDADGADEPRLITAVVTTIDVTAHPVRPVHVTLSCRSHDLDPEWRQPFAWFALMLDEHPEGPAILRDWALWADEDHPERRTVSVWIDGTDRLDETGREILGAYEYAVAKMTRAVVNP